MSQAPRVGLSSNLFGHVPSLLTPFFGLLDSFLQRQINHFLSPPKTLQQARAS